MPCGITLAGDEGPDAAGFGGLRAGRRIVAVEAARELGVNERTIRRDLKQIMIGQWRLPVRYDRRQRQWHYDGESAPLPATIISDSDRFALLLSLRSIEQYRGTPLFEKLQRIYARLLDLIPQERRTSFVSVARKIRFEGPPAHPLPHATWDTLINALDDSTTLQIVYRTGRTGQVRRRKLDPYGLVVRHREWYLIGWDHIHRAVRTFYLPRIHSAQDAEQRFRVKDGFDLDSYLATSIDGHQSTGKVHRVKLRFTKEASHLGEEFVWNATQNISREQSGRVVVEFDTGALYAVERQVLGWGGKVEVLAPRVLRSAIESNAAALLRSHENWKSRRTAPQQLRRIK